MIINIGMQLMRLTGGRFAATSYRIDAAKLDRDRSVLYLSFKLSQPLLTLSAPFHRFTIPYGLSARTDRTVRVHPQLEKSSLLSLLGRSAADRI